MAKPTIASLTADLEAAQKKIKEFEEARTAPQEEMVPKAEFEKLNEQFQNLSAEHDELTLKYESSPDLERKVAQAVENLQGKSKALLFKKMSLALGEVKRIPKNGWNDFFKYKYSQEGDILDGIRPILAEVGLMIWTSIEQDERKVVTYYSRGKEQGQKTITRVSVNFTIGCADTGQTLESVYMGEGEDESDKGLYKAYTGATKYFLTKNFLISSGDILQDDQPTDPEADTQRKNDYQNNRQNQQNGQNQRQKEQQKQQQREQHKAENDAAETRKNEAKTLWVKLAGSEEGFEGFYVKQTTQKGASHMQILDFLNGKIAEKQAEAREDKGEQTPPPEAPPQMDPEELPPPLEPVNSANKNPDDMTPEEYLAYTEENLPFPLTPSEREQILKDAREGNRNHRR